MCQKVPTVVVSDTEAKSRRRTQDTQAGKHDRSITCADLH